MCRGGCRDAPVSGMAVLPEEIPGFGHAVFRRLFEPAERFLRVFVAAFSVQQGKAEPVLRSGVSLKGGFPVPPAGCFQVLGDVYAVMAEDS